MSHTAEHGPITLNQASNGTGRGVRLTLSIETIYDIAPVAITVSVKTVREMQWILDCLAAAASEACKWNEPNPQEDKSHG